MPRPLRVEYEGAFYHVMNRGLRHAPIFSDSEDRNLFFTTLNESVERFSIKIHAFALLDNHYHLLIETPQANLGRAMRHVDGVYTQRYNRRHGLDGPLFRGRYKAQVIEEEQYLITLVAYIHLNPTRAGIEQQPQLPDRSSHSAFIGHTKKPHWLTCSFVLAHFSSINDFHQYILGMIQQIPEEHQRWDSECWKSILGSEVFIARTMNMGEIREVDSHRPDIRRLFAMLCDPTHVLDLVSDKMGISKQDLSKRSRSPKILQGQRIVATVLVRNFGLTHKRTADVLGRKSPATIGKMISDAESDKESSAKKTALLETLWASYTEKP